MPCARCCITLPDGACAPATAVVLPDPATRLALPCSLLRADQVWEIAQSEGFPSKRYTKKMLQQLKEARLVVTKPMAGDGTNRKSGHRNFGYRLNLVQQRQRQARLEARAERDGSRRGLAAQ